MKDIPRWFLYGCTAWAVLVFLACDPASKREEQQYSQDDTGVEIGRDVEILYSDSALVRVRVTAPSLYNYVDRLESRQEFPDGIKLEFLTPQLQVRSTLTAKFAIRQQDKGLIIARDSVVLTTVEHEKLETEELIWDEKTEKVRTDKFVKVTKPDEVIYGFGLEANQDFSYWKITVPKGIIKADQLDKALD
ncbi:MAG: LPS export ABC transporter periplasmic protein LptC [Lewinellaceae bacterium]|nr:LPS export ABC transporter periplasmic protein LptC [Saprospiraceae bacterium]MCB9332574.1 LPS export ABC transporter periplasmic protein LptC [Lewinellaceae bacterium]